MWPTVSERRQGRQRCRKGREGRVGKVDEGVESDVVAPPSDGKILPLKNDIDVLQMFADNKNCTYVHLYVRRNRDEFLKEPKNAIVNVFVNAHVNTDVTAPVNANVTALMNESVNEDVTAQSQISFLWTSLMNRSSFYR
ncbi:hypothetical protein E2542_SST28949 [Spatholobus suberectus]|nr:hypothetical protein E2542_SST28949 [Spatholobus suberectus]